MVCQSSDKKSSPDSEARLTEKVPDPWALGGRPGPQEHLLDCKKGQAAQKVLEVKLTEKCLHMAHS